MCDTFIALPESTEDGSVIFAKNSDREANEAQSLEYHMQGAYSANSKVKCTYIEIPQVEKTYGVLLSRPFWMWGAEMGVNEHGVVIGNEAVFTKLKVAKSGVLTGMDLLRLALERSDSAAKAKKTIIGLLQKYGQGGICGFQDKGMFYHNSFIIADKNEAWVLETAGEFWAAKKVNKYYAISNGLTIGSNFDEIHAEAEDFARQKGWVKGKFHFAKTFSDFLYTTFSACKTRKGRADELLKNNQKKINITSAISHLRDHNSTNFNPSKPLLGNTICAHAGNSIARSAPCISMFKPIWFDEEVVPDMGEELKDVYNKNSFWWKHELLHREVLNDYPQMISMIDMERDQLENRLINQVYKDHQAGFKISKNAFKDHEVLMDKWLENIKKIQVKNNSNLIYRNYWKKLNKKAEIQINF